MELPQRWLLPETWIAFGSGNDNLYIGETCETAANKVQKHVNITPDNKVSAARAVGGIILTGCVNR